VPLGVTEFIIKLIAIKIYGGELDHAMGFSCPDNINGIR
jgi:hypothetical protein